MQNELSQFTRLTNGQKRRSHSLREIMNIARDARETWLLVSPHDDDLSIGAGLWMQAAAREGINVQVLIVTDGRLGYCSLEQQKSIAAIRRAETYESFAILGIPKENVQYIGYSDGGLTQYQGRRPANPDEEHIAGYVGLQNALTHHLRRVRPDRVLVPAPTDLHPDHQITHNELMISLFHAAGAIWPELGAPLAEVPKVYEMAIYCDFDVPPNLELRGSDELFDNKLKSIAAYRSQEQIARIVDIQRASGPYEYLREVNFRFYSPERYKHLFA